MAVIQTLFNQEQKEEYISYEGNNSRALRVYFKKVAESEASHGKDISEMNEDELIKTLVGLNILREDTRCQMISLLRGYIEWARIMGKTSNDSAIFRITAESLRSKDVIVKKMIKNPSQVEEILDIAINTDNKRMMFRAGGYYKQINRARKDKLIFWLLYSGLTIYDVIGLKKNSLDVAEKYVTDMNGERYEVYEQVIPLWIEHSQAAILEKAGTKADDKDVIENKMQDSDFLFRPITKRTEVITHGYNHFSTIIKKIFSNYNESTGDEIEVLPENIKTSGIFHRLLLEEKGGQIISHEILAKKLGKVYNDKATLAMQMRKWKTDYEDWKIAFGYV